MEKSTIAAITILTFSAVLGVSPVALDALTLKTEKISFNTSVDVVSQVRANETDLGVNADPTMDFGNLPMNAAYTKYIRLTSEKKSEVEVSSTGNISEQLSFEESFIMKPVNRTVEIRIEPAQKGYYEGKIEVTTRSPVGPVGSYWIDVKAKLDSILNGLN